MNERMKRIVDNIERSLESLKAERDAFDEWAYFQWADHSGEEIKDRDSNVIGKIGAGGGHLPQIDDEDCDDGRRPGKPYIAARQALGLPAHHARRNLRRCEIAARARRMQPLLRGFRRNFRKSLERKLLLNECVKDPNQQEGDEQAEPHRGARLVL